MTDITQIIKCIDSHLMMTGEKFTTVSEASELLDRKGLLKNSQSKPGYRLRGLLREGKIPHAYQLEGKYSMWLIPISNKSKLRQIENSQEQSLNKMTKDEIINELRGTTFHWEGDRYEVHLGGHIEQKGIWLFDFGSPWLRNLKKFRKTTLIEFLKQARKERHL